MSSASAFSPAIAAAGSPDRNSSLNLMIETVTATASAISRRLARKRATAGQRSAGGCARATHRDGPGDFDPVIRAHHFQLMVKKRGISSAVGVNASSSL